MVFAQLPLHHLTIDVCVFYILVEDLNMQRFLVLTQARVRHSSVFFRNINLFYPFAIVVRDFFRIFVSAYE